MNYALGNPPAEKFRPTRREESTSEKLIYRSKLVAGFLMITAPPLLIGMAIGCYRYKDR